MSSQIITGRTLNAVSDGAFVANRADPLALRWKRAVNPLQNPLSENLSVRNDRMQGRANASSLRF